jgi:tetratricopeptide (TPR) repeat protein
MRTTASLPPATQRGPRTQLKLSEVLALATLGPNGKRLVMCWALSLSRLGEGGPRPALSPAGAGRVRGASPEKLARKYHLALQRSLRFCVSLFLFAALALPGTSLRATPSEPTQPESLHAVLYKMYSGDYAAAEQMLEAWLKEHPDDFRALNYLGEAMMDREMLQEHLFRGAAYMNSGQVFHQAANPVPPGFQQRLAAVFDRAQNLEEARLRQNDKDQYALYWLGVTHAGRTEFEFVLLRSYFAALHEGKKSLKENKRLLKLNPNFTDAYFVIGLARYTVGLLPWYIRWVASLAGAHGSVSGGIADLVRVSQHGHYAKVDARIVLVPIYEREKKYSQALALLRGLDNAYPENYLIRLEAARIQKAQGDWQAAAQTYDDAVTKFVVGQRASNRIPKAEILYRAGQAHEHLGQLKKALALYHEAGEIPGKSMQVYQANLAAARLDQQFKDTSRAKREYELVATAVPDTDLGRQARDALQNLH